MIRTHVAGSLRVDHAGETVTLTGWVARRRDHGGVAFIDLRDASGVVQVVVRDEQTAHGLRNEYCLRVEGSVARRPEGNENPHLASGEVEVVASAVEVLSEAAPLPFPVEDYHAGQVNEEVRLKYRYLDLRRDDMARAIRLRSRATHLIREVMEAQGFLDVETPYLTRSTPEGARDFLVPPGWSATTRSPAASGTRTSARIGSRSSPSSTWRCRSARARTSWRSRKLSCAGCGGRSTGTTCRGRSRG